MFLKSLHIFSSGQEIRKIEFKKGLNLILDTTSSNVLDSGNNVGKSTVLRLIDFCLGADGVDIFKDPETGTENAEVKDFLFDDSTRFVLKMTSKYNDLEIERGFASKIKVNGEEESEAGLKELISRQVFRLPQDKPSSRQLLNKFIRIKSYQVDNILRFMHPTTSDVTYELVHMYLFDFNDKSLIERKTELIKELLSANKKRLALKAISVGSVKQVVIALDKDIEKLEEQKKEFKFQDNVQTEINELNLTRELSTSNKLQLAQIRLKLEFAGKTMDQLQKAKANVDVEAIKSIYENAKQFIPNLHKTFEDVLVFHNSMIENKLVFIQENLKVLKVEEDNVLSTLNKILEIEEKLIRKISQKGALEEYDKLTARITELKEKKTENLTLISKIAEQQEKISSVKKDLDVIQAEIEGKLKNLDNSVAKFNEFYRDYAKKLYGEEFLLYYDNKDGITFKFNIESLEGAIGAGKKKGHITAFDLAYLKFLEEKQALTCRFQLNDRMEEISINQLSTAFQIADSINGQFIVPILRDKIKTLDSEFIEKCTIVSLSQSDKLFRL